MSRYYQLMVAWYAMPTVVVTAIKFAPSWLAAPLAVFGVLVWIHVTYAWLLTDKPA